MNIFHTSDAHLHHHNIIKYCSRPFSSVDEMNEILIQNHNKLVKPEDWVFYHGDLSLTRDHDRIMPWRFRMNGIWKLFIAGNHDDGQHLLNSQLAETIIIGNKNRKRRQDNSFEIAHNGRSLLLSHYPIENWNIKRAGRWLLYGHTHSNLAYNPLFPYSINVGVDAWNYYPAEWSQIKQIIDNNS
jgi:calcineurin-like phosphoesterase family protein